MSCQARSRSRCRYWHHLGCSCRRLRCTEPNRHLQQRVFDRQGPVHLLLVSVYNYDDCEKAVFRLTHTNFDRAAVCSSERGLVAIGRAIGSTRTRGGCRASNPDMVPVCLQWLQMDRSGRVHGNEAELLRSRGRLACSKVGHCCSADDCRQIEYREEGLWEHDDESNQRNDSSACVEGMEMLQTRSDVFQRSGSTELCGTKKHWLIEAGKEDRGREMRSEGRRRFKRRTRCCVAAIKRKERPSRGVARKER